MTDLNSIIASAQAIIEDEDVISRKVEICLQSVIGILKEEGDLSLRKDKCKSLLDETTEDSHVNSYTKTQLWDVATLIEQL